MAAEARRATEKQIRKEEERSLQQEAQSPFAKGALRSFFTCKHHQPGERNNGHSMRMGCSGSICKLRDMQRPDTVLAEPCKRNAAASAGGSGNGGEGTKKQPLSEINGVVSKPSSHSTASVAASSSSTSSVGGSFRRMHRRRLYGCYECHMVVDPISMLSRDSSLGTTICTCPDCGEIFVKAESLENHQAIKASKLARKHPRCTADGNELLRFHCTTFVCSIGLDGATNLCNSIRKCSLCSIVRDGFKIDSHGRIGTMATSGRAHDAADIVSDKTAMLVCRVIAGRVKRKQDDLEEYDSVAGMAGIYSNLDELFVFDPKAILPCFVVIYRS
ncbi:hypothetical protein BHE74_00017599 [Ensete ventricosum]|nr:hypothetical protein GW17_00006305 [Ensete ventricosum]RWW74461.1 hypothetical protein BHE74_00017599 [Ensete ventricosum]RZS09026.1 hypothetical protein BHM03_00040067 [Ensete ventricosum]